MWEYRGRAYNVVDGDTIDVEIDLGLRTYSRQRLRLYGVDTPERGQTGWAEAKLFVEQFVWRELTQEQTLIHVNWPLVLRTVKPTDKYGRWLAEVIWAETGENLSLKLIENELGKEYLL